MTECEHNRACRMAYGDEGCKPPCDLDLFCNLYEHKVDREALLALAEEMTWCYEGAASAEGDGTVGAWVVMQYADRIRRALGVDDGR